MVVGGVLGFFFKFSLLAYFILNMLSLLVSISVFILRDFLKYLRIYLRVKQQKTDRILSGKWDLSRRLH